MKNVEWLYKKRKRKIMLQRMTRWNKEIYQNIEGKQIKYAEKRKDAKDN